MNLKNGFNYGKKVISTGACDLVVLDEILGLVDLKVLTFDDIREMIESKPEDMTIIMTGRVMDDRLRDLADEIYNQKSKISKDSTLGMGTVDKNEVFYVDNTMK